MNKEIMRQSGFAKEVDLVEQMICPICKNPVHTENFKDEMSIKEFKISGMCQKCQDWIFG